MSKPSTIHEATVSKNSADHIREYKATRYVDVRGATAPDGSPYFHFQPRHIVHEGAWVSLEEFSTQQAPERFRAKGMYLFGDHLKWALTDAQKVTSFPPEPLLACSGWTGNYFALPSGEVFSPKGSQSPIVLFDLRPTKCGRKGKLKYWKAGVGDVAAGQPLLTFALMTVFAGPIVSLSRIHENFGFELCGEGGVGKTTAQHLAASVAGGALEPAGANFWITANTTANGLEQMYPEHSDLAMIIDEMGDFCNGDNDKVRATKTRELIFRLRSGSAKNRFDGRKGKPARFVYLTSTNVSLGALTGDLDASTSSAARDRLLTIPIAPTRKHGIFDHLPETCVNGSEAISRTQAIMLDDYGVAMPRFLKRLVKARASGEDALKLHIDAGIRRFRDAVGVDENVGSEARVADAFGLVYVAGQLAINYGALPSSLDPLEAAIEVYRLNRASAGPLPSNLQRLQRLARHPRSLSIDPKNLRSISDDELRAAPALVRIARSGAFEVLLTARQLERRFGDRSAFYLDPDIDRVAIKDKDNRCTVKRTVRSEARQERFHAFILERNPSDIDDDEDDSEDDLLSWSL